STSVERLCIATVTLLVIALDKTLISYSPLPAIHQSPVCLPAYRFRASSWKLEFAPIQILPLATNAPASPPRLPRTLPLGQFESRVRAAHPPGFGSNPRIQSAWSRAT